MRYCIFHKYLTTFTFPATRMKLTKKQTIKQWLSTCEIKYRINCIGLVSLDMNRIRFSISQNSIGQFHTISNKFDKIAPLSCMTENKFTNFFAIIKDRSILDDYIFRFVQPSEQLRFVTERKPFFIRFDREFLWHTDLVWWLPSFDEPSEFVPKTEPLVEELFSMISMGEYRKPHAFINVKLEPKILYFI